MTRGIQRCAWPRGTSASPTTTTVNGASRSRRSPLLRIPAPRGRAGRARWTTILNKREGYRAAFRDFDPAAVARFDQRDGGPPARGSGDRTQPLKIASAVTNARAFLAVQQAYGSFDAYVWTFVGAPRSRTGSSR